MQLFPEEMEVLYDRPFSAEMLSEDFEIKGGSWYVDEAGWLIGENRRNSAAMVISKGEYFGDVLIEFDAATVLPATRDKPPRQSPRHQRGRNRRPLPQAPLTRASPLTRVLTAQSAVRGGFFVFGAASKTAGGRRDLRLACAGAPSMRLLAARNLRNRQACSLQNVPACRRERACPFRRMQVDRRPAEKAQA